MKEKYTASTKKETVQIPNLSGIYAQNTLNYRLNVTELKTLL